MLTDRFGRALTYLRVSVTGACNLKCLYCMPKGKEATCSTSQCLDRDEIVRLVRIALSMGVKKVRITGGEPLLRKDILEIVKGISSLNGIEDLSLTTNGIILSRYSRALKEAGLMRINVSLDTLNGDKFSRITGQRYLKDVIAGIDEAKKSGFSPIKVNVVVLRGVNDNELLDFLDFGRDQGCIVRFIEFMPMVQASDWEKHFIPRAEILARLKDRIDPTIVPWGSTHEPAKYYKTINGEVFGVISPVSHGFCEACNRLRITADGTLRACITPAGEKDLRALMKKGDSDEELASLFKAVAMMKPATRVFAEPMQDMPMYRLGG